MIFLNIKEQVPFFINDDRHHRGLRQLALYLAKVWFIAINGLCGVFGMIISIYRKIKISVMFLPVSFGELFGIQRPITYVVAGRLRGAAYGMAEISDVKNVIASSQSSAPLTIPLFPHSHRPSS